jgi:hypothetical protein
MNSRFPFGLLLAGFVATGCVVHHHSAASQSTAQTSVASPAEPIVTPDTSLTAKVVKYNSVGRFVVLSFPVGQMPQTGQMLFLYRAGMKVGEIKITGPQRDNDTVADVVTGDAQEGDEVREQ